MIMVMIVGAGPGCLKASGSCLACGWCASGACLLPTLQMQGCMSPGSSAAALSGDEGGLLRGLLAASGTANWG